MRRDEPIGWGIVGTGRIAHVMADTLALMDDARVVAVASQSPERAAAFADGYGARAAVGSAAEVATADGVDAVYVASTNERHPDDTIACLEAGRAVLCEKPVALDLAGARRMVSEARHQETFLMEAMWMRFQPSFSRLVRSIEQGAIGTVQHVQADFGFPAPFDPADRLFDPDLGGGSLLDLGIYPTTLAVLLAGVPDAVAAVRVPAPTGVDAQVAAVMRHPGGVLSVVSSSFAADTSLRATVSGDRGRLELVAPFHHSTRIRRWVRGEVAEDVDCAYEGSGYRFEVEEVHRCLRQGWTESPRHPLSDTLAVMDTLDRIRAAVV